nr:hypothetical protein [Tanacetum cinerariifolium]
DEKKASWNPKRESMICCGQFATKIEKVLGILTDAVLDRLSAPTYYQALDVITLRELTGRNGRLIAEGPMLGVPRVAMQKDPRPTITDLYDKLGRMESRTMDTHCREPMHHQGMTRRSKMMRSSVQMTWLDFVTVLDEKKASWNPKRESMICCGQFATKIAKVLGILTDAVLDGLSAPTYYRALDVITLRELTGRNGRLIAEDLMLGVPRVAIQKDPRPTITDLYAGLFEHMAGHYGYTLQGAYAPPGYDEEKQDDEE